ncbi:PIR Superfamily Protein [Plasmodium ovale curtisi]|uniref:PIR Superfamily Protein n=1 Tax=Plasmodium ovale curtisi TaxID=864141 RepID=A0A1A8XBN0_PLAOA|nr:PIR Superfamily Protein [Plasmodium ovale curtisi]
MASGDSQNEFGYLFGETQKELFSEKFYQKRETDVLQLNKYKEHCDDIIFFPQKIGYMKYICKKILKYLEHSEQWEENKSVYDECILLNYWVYDTLNTYFNHNTDDTNDAFGTLQLKWSYLIDDSSKKDFYKKCKPLYDMFKHHDWKRRKELYDYYVDFDTLSRTAKVIPSKCEEYYKIIEGKKSLYNHFENECLSNEYNCPELYKKFPDYNPNKVLSSLPCHEKIEAKKAAAAAEASHRALTSQQYHSKGIQPGSNSSGTGLTQENSEIGKTVGHSVLGVAPVLLTATALYRYTPIGSWIRSIGGNSTNSISYMDGGEMEEFLLNPQESGNMLFGDTGNYISYQPM